MGQSRTFPAVILADFAAWPAPSLDHEGVEDWSDCFDPDELRIRLDVALEENAELHEEVGRLSADNARLRSLLGLGARSAASPMPPVAEPVAPVPVSGGGGLPYADASSSAEAKIALFRALFAGREDVYARRWVSSRTGRTGWSPAEDNPYDKNKDEADRVFWPLTDETVYGHLDPALAEYLVHAGGIGFGRWSRPIESPVSSGAGWRGMMIGRAAETGVPGCDERVRDAATAADERPGE